MKDVKEYMYSEVCETNVFHDDAVAKVRANMQDEDPIYEWPNFSKYLETPPERGSSVRSRCPNSASVTSCLLNMSQSAISHQLRILKQARMVKNPPGGEGCLLFFGG